ncbi:hypothetical protein [Paenibacillus naphthalenovorans]|uniref:YubB ferredoxin-like domain-containing protein n=1 Tax=Paenibacillus naphthalenovorans TaxID=162209 RepID=A0A0U2VF94_9BACL|nr:hypothetical protein [Paenibacillus naphthalenovorans]ALS22195.1 hypothetical protein IJ22_18210 [Paenibacillus naphthalenovorans]
MGMYTSFRCKLKLKREFVPVIEDMMSKGLGWNELNTDNAEIKEFSLYNRADFIPYGGLAYAPDMWDQENSTTWKRQIENGIWTFQCSCKNSETFREFMRKVVPVIAEESVHLELFYEEDIYSTMYRLIDGKVEEIEEKNKYGYDDDDYKSGWSSL